MKTTTKISVYWGSWNTKQVILQLCGACSYEDKQMMTQMLWSSLVLGGKRNQKSQQGWTILKEEQKLADKERISARDETGKERNSV